VYFLCQKPALARPSSRESQSRGFWAKPGRNITTWEHIYNVSLCYCKWIYVWWPWYLIFQIGLVTKRIASLPWARQIVTMLTWLRHRRSAASRALSVHWCLGGSIRSGGRWVNEIIFINCFPKERVGAQKDRALSLFAVDHRQRFLKECPTPLLDQYFDNHQVHAIVLTQGLNGEPLWFPLHVWYARLHPAIKRTTNEAEGIQAILRRKQVFWAPSMMRRRNTTNRQGSRLQYVTYFLWTFLIWSGSRSPRRIQDSPRKTVHEQYLLILQVSMLHLLPSISIYIMKNLLRQTPIAIST